MNPFLRQLHDLSYSQQGIGKSCGFLLLMGLATAGITGSILRLVEIPEPPPPDAIEQIYGQYLLVTYQTEFEADLLPGFPTPDPRHQRLFSSPTEKWLPELKEQAGSHDPESGVRFALGLWEQDQGNLSEAIELFHQENLEYPHPLVRQMELDTILRSRDPDRLLDLRKNPDYTHELHPGYFFRMGMLTQNWPMILRWFWPAEYYGIQPQVLLFSLLAGAIWGALILSLLPHRRSVKIFSLAVAALGLGWISTWPTIWSGIWLDTRFHLEEGIDFASSLLYFLVSVGLREEVCKLLLFIPFLFWVRKPGRDIEALIFGALVGLGFAVEENINYFTNYQGSGVVVSRFVSANLLHLTLTGVNALALTRAVRDPGRWTSDFVQTLAITIGLHGLYNTLLSQPIPGLGDMSYFSGTALAGCAFYFFRNVQELSPVRASRISRTALFCWGFCTLFNLELLTASVWLPFSEALYLTGQSALSGVFIGYIFLHEIREPLAA